MSIFVNFKNTNALVVAPFIFAVFTTLANFSQFHEITGIVARVL